MRFRDWDLRDRWAQKTLKRQAVNVRPMNQIRKPAVTQSDSINAVRSCCQSNHLCALVGIHQTGVCGRGNVVPLVNDDRAECRQVAA